MTDRTFTPTPAQRHLKRLSERLIKAVGGVEAAASYCRIGKTQLSDCCNPNVAAFLPADAVEDLEGAAGEPLVTRWLARATAHLLVPLPEGPEDEDGLMASLAELTSELGDVARAVCDALKDRQVTPGEAAVAIEQLDELQRAGASLRLKLEALAGSASSGMKPGSGSETSPR